ncbi:hypothetical protein [Microcoleus sp. D3_18a_C4]
MNATTDIVQKLWNLCHVLRDDGITYIKPYQGLKPSTLDSV